MPKTENKPEMTKCTLNLPAALVLAAKHLALDEGRDFQDLVADGLRKYLASTKKGGQR